MITDLLFLLISVKQFPAVNRINMFRGKVYNNQERPNISHGKVLVTCVAILGAQPNIIRSINDMLRMSVIDIILGPRIERPIVLINTS